MAQDWAYPIPTRYGPGRLAEIAALAGEAGMTRPLIVTDRGSRALPFIAATERHLAAGGLSARVFSEISPNPRDDEIGAASAAFLAGGHDGVVAIGGGSAMDGAKALCLSVWNDHDLMDFDYLRPAPEVRAEAPFPPLVTVPTTAGTGAETECTAMITETARGMKWCLAHPRARVSGTILDPALTVGLPRDLTAWTGVDALVHAVEAYCVPAFYPLCDGAALEAIRLIWRHLPAACETPEDLEARGGMLVGSYLAGVAFLQGLGLVHAISHMVGAEYDTHHGLTNAVLLPAVLRFNAPAIEGRLGPMAGAMGLADRRFDAFYGAICGRLDALGIPRRLTELGVTADRAHALAAKALEDAAAGTNPRPASQAEIAAIIEDALTVGR